MLNARWEEQHGSIDPQQHCNFSQGVLQECRNPRMHLPSVARDLLGKVATSERSLSSTLKSQQRPNAGVYWTPAQGVPE
jgi:hypothetical protein